MASFPGAVVSKPGSIVNGLTIFDFHVDDVWDEVVAMQGEMLGGGAGGFTLDIRPTAAGNAVLRTRQSGDAQNRWSLTGAGTLAWGSGSATADVSLFRTAARTLELDGAARVIAQNSGDIPLEVRGASGQSVDLLRVTADTGSPTRLAVSSAGQLQLPLTGSSGGVLIGGDTQLYRSAADELTTPDAVVVAGAALTLTNSAGLLATRSAALASTVVHAAAVTGDAQDRFRMRADGGHAWGPGSGAQDTTLTRTGVNELTVSGTLICQAIQSAGQQVGGDLVLAAGNALVGTSGTSGSTNKVRVSVAADTNDRLDIRADGRLSWGPGNAATDATLERISSATLELGDNLHVKGTLTLGSTADVNLYRASADVLKTDDSLQVAGAAGITLLAGAGALLQRSATATSTLVEGSRVSGDASDRYTRTADGALSWGGGSGAVDVTLYRSAANVLQTDDHLALNGSVQLRADPGSAGNPGIVFIGSLTTGLALLTSPARLAFSFAGSEAAFANAAGLAAPLLWPAGASQTRLGVAGGSTSGRVATQGLVEVAGQLAVSNTASFGAFPSPGAGSLYVDQALYLGSVSDVSLQRTAAGDIALVRSGSNKTRLRLNKPDGTVAYLEIDNDNQLVISST